MFIMVIEGAMIAILNGSKQTETNLLRRLKAFI